MHQGFGAAMSEPTPDQRLSDLERRVNHLERIVLGAPAAKPVDPTPAPPAMSRPAPVRVTPPPLPISTPKAQPTPLIAPTPVLPYPSTKPVVKSLNQNPLEQVIGIKWAGWIGAIVLVIGAALGIKYAYDSGLFPTISPAARLILMSLGGFGLIAAGEWVFRKVGRLSATGFFGAGVA